MNAGTACALLLFMLGAAAPSYHEHALQKILAAPNTEVMDLRRSPRLKAQERKLLLGITQELTLQGQHLRILLVDAGPQFSLGDFTTRIAREGSLDSQDLLIVATSTGLHAQAPWLSYRAARQLALQHQPAYQSQPLTALRAFALDISKEGLRRSRHRASMIGLASLAFAAIFFILFKAALRRRRQRVAPPQETPNSP